ncbi:helix-turn-helix domain-containing protein [Streptomyces sp. NBC_00425]|uniref:helix-turn-helix domain-containing protein n=1 Tax=Streptomyces sp. NBC_00425 TaxID=2975740 RepID=UPI002E1EEA20
MTADVIAELVPEVRPLWHERHQARLASRQGKRAMGAGAKHRLVFIDRLLATLVHLRHGTTHDVLACWFGADRSTITRAINEVVDDFGQSPQPYVGADGAASLGEPYPRRARHRTSQELAGTGPPPRPPRAHERHGPGHRQLSHQQM